MLGGIELPGRVCHGELRPRLTVMARVLEDLGPSFFHNLLCSMTRNDGLMRLPLHEAEQSLKSASSSAEW